MITWISQPPPLNDSYLHRKMRALSIYQDVRWYQIEDTGLMCVRNAFAIIDCPFKCEELLQCLRAFGVNSYVTNGPYGGQPRHLLSAVGRAQPTGEMANVFAVTSQISAFFAVDFDDYYTRVSHVVRHKNGAVYAHESAVCAVLFGVLEGVCSAKEHCGHAGALIAQVIQSQAGTVYCACNPALIPFYTKRGFVHIDTITEESNLS